MTQMAMPFLVVNLGCEMLFVIDQRLTAQQVAPDKAIKVLTDVTGILVNDRLLNEVFAVQPLGSHNSVRDLLQDIASASIMRLDEYSMNKLWDLMTMVLKWQLSVSGPNDLLSITDRHLREVAALHFGSESAAALQSARERFSQLGRKLKAEDLTCIRNIILMWLDNCKSKISLLLRMGVQNRDSSFVPRCSLNYEILENLGCNIYKRYGKSSTNECSSDTSEVTFLVSQITGVSQDLSHAQSNPREDGEIRVSEPDLSKCLQQIIKNRERETLEVPTDTPKSLQADLLELLDSQEF